MYELLLKIFTSKIAMIKLNTLFFSVLSVCVANFMGNILGTVTRLHL